MAKATVGGGSNSHRGCAEFDAQVVSMAEVPEGSSRSKYAALFEQLYKLSGDKAMRVKFGSESQANGARTSLRKQAESAGCKLRANRGAAGEFVWFFWVDRPEGRKA